MRVCKVAPEFGGFRRCIVGLSMFNAVKNFNGTHNGGLFVGLIAVKYGAQHACGRGFTLGAGNADHCEIVIGVSRNVC